MPDDNEREPVSGAKWGGEEATIISDHSQVSQQEKDAMESQAKEFNMLRIAENMGAQHVVAASGEQKTIVVHEATKEEHTEEDLLASIFENTKK